MTVPSLRRARSTAVLGVVAVLALAACSSGGPTPSTTVTPDPAVDKSAPPSPEVPVTWPLTGVTADQVAERPALAVKIENAPVARPQTGLEAADIVWEEVVEGGVSRFVAVYHSAIPDVVEPVRSVRPMDPAIVAPLDGLLAYSGAQPPFIEAVEASGTQSVIMDRGDAGFSRDRSRYAPHNVVGDMQAFLDQADGERSVPPPAQFDYADAPGEGTASADGKKAGTLDVVLSPAQRSVWDWDADSGTWLRSEGSQESVSSDGTRHAARNVLAMSTVIVNTAYKDPGGAPVPETQLVGSGQGVLAAGGKVLTVKWSKEDLHAPVELTHDGEPVELDPGSTWIELVPRGTGSWSVS
ncbi:DUF3048 domain-containing protein [Isoptericola sp. NEAU-Y5]|uniref:DUF3048 domain-containing protein n=1 Tax=Isoptericola luteus TaxID=2879484 RepID=A0ABS7ZKH7_9MICO|nr:DUF3048 domain-containing protein [Isoptericola sp. NEAU-Y5]MCA5895027.1 DUF3048 domain-containing protein [Isoptericola sp. NEAU-Y5]